MTDATIEVGKSGRIEIRGDLSFQSVPELWNLFCAHISARDELEIDLSQIARSDSAGLALLVECLRQAHRSGKTVRFMNIPAQMLAIARVSSLDQVLPFQRDQPLGSK